MTLNAREKEIKTGWTIVTGILGFILFLSAFRLLFPLMFGVAPNPKYLVGLLVNLGLCWMVYQGRGWARALLSALLILSGIYVVISAWNSEAGFIAFVLVFGLLYLAGGISLLAIPAVNRYFEYVNS